MEAFPKMNKNVSGTMVADFPRDSDGKIEKKMIINPTSHCGFICHYHVSENKVDPISFDYNRFLLGIYKNNPDQKSLETTEDIGEKEKYFKKLNLFSTVFPSFIIRTETIRPLK
jgi:hypothetical protein